MEVFVKYNCGGIGKAELWRYCGGIGKADCEGIGKAELWRYW